MYRNFYLCVSLCFFSFLSITGQAAKGMKKREVSQEKERHTPSVAPQIETYQSPDTFNFYISNTSSWTPISFSPAWFTPSTTTTTITELIRDGIQPPSSPITIPISAHHSDEDLSRLTSFELNRKILNYQRELLSLYAASLFPQDAEKSSKEDHEQEEPPQQAPEKSD